MSGQAGRKRALAIAFALTIFGHSAAAQAPETHALGSLNCATEGGEIVVRRVGTTITYWKGNFCGSTGCTTYELTDLTAEGTVSVTVSGQFPDGGEILYRTTAYRSEPDWQHNGMIGMDYQAGIGRDIRLIGRLFGLTEAALAKGESIVDCG